MLRSRHLRGPGQRRAPPQCERICQVDGYSRNGGSGHVVTPANDSARLGRRISRPRPNGPPAASTAGPDGSSRRRDPAWQTIRKGAPVQSDRHGQPCLRVLGHSGQRERPLHPRMAPAPSDHIPCRQDCWRMRPHGCMVAMTALFDSTFAERGNRQFCEASVTESGHVAVHDAAPFRSRPPARSGQVRDNARGGGVPGSEGPGNSALVARRCPVNPAAGSQCPAR